ncbi:hypothetical protein C3B55_01004 [Candidatus Pseudomonas adelgestsugas]|uniref:Uncharacterized protein n=1 Tax=Candidatus Pseudomonas adelgestsugas TaxID=1302376 RepID=A0ABX5R9H6_9PSED|nr:hypothetical protein C3B55_01004 [Candidatus Pseudomonas adelgestsugas]
MSVLADFVCQLVIMSVKGAAITVLVIMFLAEAFFSKNIIFIIYSLALAITLAWLTSSTC